MSNSKHNNDCDEFMGFPKVVSKLETQNKAEILMEALGPSLKKLLKQCPNKSFSKMTAFVITI